VVLCWLLLLLLSTAAVRMRALCWCVLASFLLCTQLLGLLLLLGLRRAWLLLLLLV
jgi:hypothetical protein